MSDSTAERDERPVPGGGTVRVGRAVFLGTMLAGVASLAVGKRLWSPISSAISPVESLVPLVPSKGWRIYTIADSMPRFDAATWRLSIGGLVEQPHSLGYEELRALPKVEQVSTFHCVTGWTVKDVRWGGVRVADVLAAASPKQRAHALRFVSAEQPYDDFLTLSRRRCPT